MSFGLMIFVVAPIKSSNLLQGVSFKAFVFKDPVRTEVVLNSRTRLLNQDDLHKATHREIFQSVLIRINGRHL
jgi:hypothetical protein